MSKVANKIKFLANHLSVPYSEAQDMYSQWYEAENGDYSWEDILTHLSIPIIQWTQWSESNGIEEEEGLEVGLIKRIKAACTFIQECGGIVMAEKTLAAIKKMENVKTTARGRL